MISGCVTTGAETARLKGHSGSINALCVLPDGRLASGFEDGTIRLWDVARGTEAARLEGHSSWVRALAPAQLVAPGDDVGAGHSVGLVATAGL
jgi:WD40 repeat protein